MPRGIESLSAGRLTLTCPVAGDWPDFRAMHEDPRVMAPLGGLEPAPVVRALFDRMLRHWDEHGFGWWTARDASGRYVGRGGVRRVRLGAIEELEVGYAIVADAWGSGFATEIARAGAAAAFERIGAPSLCAFTTPANAASRRVMEKVGLAYERDVEHAGVRHVLYRLTAEQWREIAPRRPRVVPGSARRA